MAQIIARLYATPDKAASAVKDLKNYGYSENEIFVCAPSDKASQEDLAASAGQAGLGKAEAGAYAAEVAKGATLVVVHAPFGAGMKATSLLERHEPAATPAAARSAPPAPASSSASSFSLASTSYEESAPLSSMMNWKTTHSDATPLSNFFKIPTLSDFSLSRKFGFSELSEDSAPLSKKFGWPLLRENDPAPLSSKLNWPVLRD